MTVLDLASRLGDLSAVPGRQRAPWAGHGYVRGWGVFGLPFDSGHVLALRNFPESDSGPYRSLWHRDPEGKWSLYVHGPHLNTACPRYYGAASTTIAFATIDLAWTGPASLRVRVDRPALEWTLTASETRTLRLLNTIAARLPLWTWRPRALIRVREWLARLLGMGNLRLIGATPSGYVGALMPERMYFVEKATATLEGVDLGRPTHAHPNPTIGHVPLPARGVLAIGQVIWVSSDASGMGAPSQWRRIPRISNRRRP